MADIHDRVGSSIGDKGEGVRREDIRAAIDETEKLRALHAALMRPKLRFDSNSPISTQLSAQDYPIFTPSHADKPLLPGCPQQSKEDRSFSQSRDEYFFDGIKADEVVWTDCRMVVPFPGKELPSKLENLEEHLSSAEDQNFEVCSCNSNVLDASLKPDYCKSRRNSLGDLKSASSCNQCKPAIISSESDGITKNCRKSNVIVPYTDSQSSLDSQPSNKVTNLSWLFPGIKKKKGSLPIRSKSEEVLQTCKDLEMVSVETLKKELAEANESRDAALVEVAEMKSTLGELSQKLEYLETYCEELKRAMSQDALLDIPQPNENLKTFPKRGATIDGNAVSKEKMVEEFLQIVSEARFSVKQFCKTLIEQVEETDHTLVNSLNLLLQPYRLSLNSKYSQAVSHHLEAVINQSLYQDFENCVYQKNGSLKFLNPEQDRLVKFQSFIALRNLSWSEVLRKGTKYYSNEFSTFCDDKMREILATLGWTRPWAEQLLQAFFSSAKCIWLVHLLAFSFSTPLSILRVDENSPFEPHFMEDVFGNRPGPHVPSRVKRMVMPGFYVEDRVIRCKVVCRYKLLA